MVDWQVGQKLKGCVSYVLSKQHLVDIHFLFPGESNLVPVGAHRLVLALRSPVFEAMFYGLLADGSKEIEIVDIPVASFSLFLQYIYTDEVKLNDEDVLGVLRASSKYCVPSLTDLCSRYLVDNLTTETVCEVLEQASLYGVKTVEHHCLVYIDYFSADVFKTDGFHCVSRQSLERILISDTLQVDEIVIYQAVDSWATKECKRRSLVSTVLEDRREAIDSILKLIRFPIMNLRQFSDEVVGKPPGVLSKDETIKLYQLFTGKADVVHDFSTELRKQNITLRVSRFEEMERSRFWYQGFEDKFTFSCNVDMVFVGLSMMESIQRCGCSANLDGVVEITSKDDQESILYKALFAHEKGPPPFPPQDDEVAKDELHDIEINFEQPIFLVPAAKYGVYVKVNANYQECECNEICDCYDIVSNRKPNEGCNNGRVTTTFCNHGEGIVKTLLLNHWR